MNILESNGKKKENKSNYYRQTSIYKPVEELLISNEKTENRRILKHFLNSFSGKIYIIELLDIIF